MLPANKQGSFAMADSIPVLDLAPLRAGAPGALERLGEELRQAFTEVGFYFVRNHGIPQALLDQTFDEAARFHAQSLDAKLALKINEHNIGYMPMRGATTRVNAVGEVALEQALAALGYALPSDAAAWLAEREQDWHTWQQQQAHQQDLADGKARHQPFAHGVVERKQQHAEQHDGRACHAGKSPVPSPPQHRW